MGANGWITIYNQAKFHAIVKEHNVDLNCVNWYNRELGGVKVVTVYDDNCGGKGEDVDDELFEDAYIDTWEVWT